jgi:hypothetical protein
MNKPTFFTAALLLFGIFNLTAQNWNTGSIQGEGEVIKQEISLSSFEGVELGFSGDVMIAQGNTQKVVIEGQQNIIDNIKREVSGGKWKIHFIKNVKNAKPVTVYITVPNLDYVTVNGSGTIKSSGRFKGLKELELIISGSGDIKMDYDAVETKVRISGSGDVEVVGSTKSLDVSISGSGDVVANNLDASRCKVQISGSGDASVMVNGELDAQVYGSGDVRYRGNASVTAKVNGSGEVSKM